MLWLVEPILYKGCNDLVGEYTWRRDAGDGGEFVEINVSFSRWDRESEDEAKDVIISDKIDSLCKNRNNEREREREREREKERKRE